MLYRYKDTIINLDFVTKITKDKNQILFAIPVKTSNDLIIFKCDKVEKFHSYTPHMRIVYSSVEEANKEFDKICGPSVPDLISL
jgi:hypothetical protein